MIPTPGTPTPLGSSIKDGQINFALFSGTAKDMSLCLFERDSGKLHTEIPLSPETNKTGAIWHVAIPIPEKPLVYAYKIAPAFNNKQRLLLDPYAKSLSTPNEWGYGYRHHLNTYVPLADLPDESTFDWGNDSPPRIPLNDLVIYEMSIRAFTQDQSAKAVNPGTFLGVIEKIPYLKELGVNAIELLPVHEFNECEYAPNHPDVKVSLYNFWGYSTVNFFSPMNRFSSSSEKRSAINEFKTMVKSLHQNGIEVILDVVFNHTAEGDETGPVISFKGIDNAAYYLTDEHGTYLNFSGCGNSLNANQPMVMELIVDSLVYWVAEMHVDGFRFDLASALVRGPNGTPLNPAPLIQAITEHPVLSKVKLIAEPWDAAGFYQVGNFAPETKKWSEWNGKYRDSIRRFIKGSPWSSGEFATRLCGSEDLYTKRTPCNSINFITSHDGFTLADLVSYNLKHNIDNGEGNRDGSSDNISWNCGVEGPTDNKKILSLRERQMKNFHVALMLSQGIPMLTMGDEYGHTKSGNNNTWCQDNGLNWFQWDMLGSNAAFHRFYKLMIHFRKTHPILKRESFLTQKDIDWHGLEAFKPDWNNERPFVAFTLKDSKHNRDLFAAFNSQDHVQLIQIPPPPYFKRWHWVVNTANPSPTDFYEGDNSPVLNEATYRLSPFSAIVLEART